MTTLTWLIPIALAMGFVALCAFLWSLRTGQYEDMDGAAERVLLAQGDDHPIAEPAESAACGRPPFRPGDPHGPGEPS